jgi:hypothetical protein
MVTLHSHIDLIIRHSLLELPNASKEQWQSLIALLLYLERGKHKAKRAACCVNSF